MSRKYRYGSAWLIEIELEKPPLLSNLPAEFVIHADKGVARFVAVNQA